MFRELRYTDHTNTPAGRVSRKEQGDNNGSKRLLYGYNPTNAPHATRRIYDPTTTNLRQMLWDANGNIVQISEYLYDANTQQAFLQDFRNHYWDEDDRLNLVLDNSNFSYYLYSNDGQRVAKLTGSAFTLGTGFATNALLDNYTLYPFEYLTITTQGYTKYYYANGTRIASRLGSGGFEKMTRLCTLDQNLTYNANTLFNSVVARVGEDMPQEYVSDPCPAYNNDMAGFRVPLQPLNFEPNFGITAQQNVLQAFRQNYANEETYYFHGNHLGSANWVTLQNASPTQFLLHLPYGEEFVKQLSGSYDERFTFTGKEKDIETGYYYFGARFDNVDLGFMSVDPMSDKYPSISPYAYCAWNPVKYVDPEGEQVYIDGNGDQQAVTEAMKQMQRRSDNLIFHRNDDGLIWYTGEAKTRKEKHMVEIINSKNIKVKLHVQRDNSNGVVNCGAFGGNSFISKDKKKIEAKQAIDINTSAIWDELANSPGNMIWHEIAEGYAGGQASIVSGVEAKPATSENDPVYLHAHTKAGIFFPGTLTELKEGNRYELEKMIRTSLDIFKPLKQQWRHMDYSTINVYTVL